MDIGRWNSVCTEPCMMESCYCCGSPAAGAAAAPAGAAAEVAAAATAPPAGMLANLPLPTRRQEASCQIKQHNI